MGSSVPRHRHPSLAGTPSRSRGAFRPSFALRFTPSRNQGRGEGRVPAGTRKTPVRKTLHTQCTRETQGSRTSGLPCAVVGTAYFPRSPRRRIPFASVTSRKSRDAAPVEAPPYSRGLTVATTARTTRFCPTLARRRSYNAACKSLTGFGSIHRPALHSHPRRRCQRPPRPDPRLVTTYDRPLSWIRMDGIYDKSEFR